MSSLESAMAWGVSKSEAGPFPPFGAGDVEALLVELVEVDGSCSDMAPALVLSVPVPVEAAAVALPSAGFKTAGWMPPKLS